MRRKPVTLSMSIIPGCELSELSRKGCAVKTFAAITIAIVLSLVMGGCPALEVIAPGATQSGLQEGVYTGVIAIDQIIRGVVEIDQSSQVNDTIAVDASSNIFRNGVAFSVGQELVSETDLLLETFDVVSIQEVDGQVLITVAVEAVLKAEQVTLTGTRNDTFTQVDDNTISLRQTINLAGGGLTISTVAEGTYTR